MITELRLTGFKSFLERRIKFNRLTLLTGLNSSGKSSIIQALLMVEKAVLNQSNIVLEGHGSSEELVNRYYNGNIIIEVSDDSRRKMSLEIGFENEVYSYVKNAADFLFPEIIYISANRFGPKTSIPIFNDRVQRRKIGSNGENLLQFIEYFANHAIDSRLIHENSEGVTVLFNLRGWLSVISPNVKLDFHIDKNSDSSYTIFNGHRAANVGFGLSYSLSVIASLLIGTVIPNSLTVIENPEAHLHPKGQTEMARLIALCVEAGSQVIIETHSDHIFDGLRIFAKNGRGFAQKLQLHWLELDNDQNTEVYSPEIDDSGRVDQWPKGMFDQFDINASDLV